MSLWVLLSGGLDSSLHQLPNFLKEEDKKNTFAIGLDANA
jgi:asparagine synthetase B (glutamine-hydrolysing)